MGTRLRVFLNAEENRTLFELRTATTVPQRVKDRAEVIRLSHQGMYVLTVRLFFLRFLKWLFRNSRGRY